MTNEQFERWKDFALRMARTAYRTARRPSAKWIEEIVETFFYRLDEPEISCIVSWDHSTRYPDGGACDCAGDILSEFLAEYEGGSRVCGLCSTPRRDKGYAEYVAYKADRKAKCRCDEMDMLYHEQWSEQWGGPVNCCIRAGLDCASAPSAGVVGFTAGDVRRMYPEGVPDWVFPPDEQLQYWLSDEMDGTFAELPDSMGVVL